MIRNFGGMTGLASQPTGLDLGAGGGSNIKSIQRGKVTLTGQTSPITLTISSIDPTKSIVRITSKIDATTPADRYICVTIENSTTLKFLIYNSSFYNSSDIEWEVVEYIAVKCRLAGEVSLSPNQLDQLYTISTINTAKSIMYFSYRTNGGSSYPSVVSGNIHNSTNIRFTSSTSTGTFWIDYQIIEFN